MKALVGEYHSSELDFRYQIFIMKGKLFCKIGNNKLEQLQFIDMSHIMVDEYLSLNPIRRKGKEVSAFTLGVGDIKNILFERVD